MRSLSARLLLSLFVLLILFFGVTIAALDFVFRDLAERSLRELLDAQVLTLISTGGTVLWRSPSTVGTGVSFGPVVTQGERRYETIRTDGQDDLVALSAGFHWEVDAHSARDYVFSVAASLAPSRTQLARFRTQLFVWFGGIAALMVVSLALVLRQALSPLRRLAHELQAVEAGAMPELGSGYPTELQGVTRAVNALLKSERMRLERYRNTLGNVAHSLKTPIAVMRTVLGEPGEKSDRDRVLAGQVQRMDEIVQHQLRRAAASGGATLGQTPVALQPALMELRVTLLRVYAAKDLSIRVECDSDVAFLGDRGDLLELLGNVADNACKYCESTVEIRAAVRNDHAPHLVVTIDDDGPGVPEELRARIFERGVRADESMAGHGLGLSMARDIVAQYQGELEIAVSAQGGARVTLSLPGRRLV